MISETCVGGIKLSSANDVFTDADAAE